MFPEGIHTRRHFTRYWYLADKDSGQSHIDCVSRGCLADWG